MYTQIAAVLFYHISDRFEAETVIVGAALRCDGKVVFEFKIFGAVVFGRAFLLPRGGGTLYFCVAADGRCFFAFAQILPQKNYFLPKLIQNFFP